MLCEVYLRVLFYFDVHLGELVCWHNGITWQKPSFLIHNLKRYRGKVGKRNIN